MGNSITEKELKDVNWKDISIKTLSAGQEVLVLVCETKEGSDKLHDLLRNHFHGLKVWTNKEGNYCMRIEIADTDFVLEFHSTKNETNYPPVKKLHNQITHITTGTVAKGGGPGALEINSDLKRLGEVDIGKSFSKAKEIQFVLQDGENSPSIALLVFEDYNQIIRAEAVEAFNDLASMSKANPVMAINVEKGLASIRIWDIVVDLDVKVNGLRYVPLQLENFLKKVGPKDAFVFLLGLPPEKDGTSVIVPTTREGINSIIIKGYVYSEAK